MTVAIIAKCGGDGQLALAALVAAATGLRCAAIAEVAISAALAGFLVPALRRLGDRHVRRRCFCIDRSGAWLGRGFRTGRFLFAGLALFFLSLAAGFGFDAFLVFLDLALLLGHQPFARSFLAVFFDFLLLLGLAALKEDLLAGNELLLGDTELLGGLCQLGRLFAAALRRR